MIEIVPYNEQWPHEFRHIAAKLRGALGDLALRIDHIGSTSVAGLAAKDVIDVQASIMSFEVIEQVRMALESIGYAMRGGFDHDHHPPRFTGADSEWEKRFFFPPAGQRRTNLHMRVLGRANQRYALLFRDYLRAHEDIAAAYAAVKLRLAHYHADDIEAYVDIKDPVCDVIMGGAERWAASVGWQVGSSDA